MPRRRLTQEAYVSGILSGDRVVLSKAITLVESSLQADRELAGAVIEACLPHTGGSYRIGITGVPGVGKSTFIDAFGTYLTRQGKRVAVLAVDPSSSISRGSILGDKTRMDRLSLDPKAYVRPSPTGGSLGGVSRKTRESLLLCEAAGFEVVLVETVGVGQSEVAVRSMVDAFLLLMLPNAGDELQGIKKGIMEMADLMVINKSDGAFAPKARVAKSAYAQALRLFPKSPSGWRPPVLLCSSTEETGIDSVWERLEGFRQTEQQGQWWEKRRARQQLKWMEEALQHLLMEQFFQDEAIRKALPAFRQAVAEGRQAPIQAAEQLIQKWKTGGGGLGDLRI